MSTTAMSNPRQKNNNRDKGRGHITNRAGYGNANTNSHRKDGPDYETSSSGSSPVSGVYKDSRTAMMLCSVLGSRTTVKTRNGKRYEGFTTGFSSEGDIALSDAKLESEDNLQDANLPGVVIARGTFIVCKAAGVDFKGLAVGASEFTDAGITSRSNGNSEVQMKVLQPWDDDGTDCTSLLLDENQKGWEPIEMFQVNENKFNVTSSYSEDLDGYTTPKVATNTEGYEEREKMAAMQAEEIEKSDVYKARIAKELSETSEEAKFASVNDVGSSSRSNDGYAGKDAYTIPALRAADQANMRNNSAGRGQGRAMPKQNTPYSNSTANHSQSVHNSRHHLNNYHQGPPPPTNGRNQIVSHQQRQQQQSPSPGHGPPPPIRQQQQQPTPHSMQQPQPSMQPQPSQHQRSLSAHQQLMSPNSKLHPNVPATLPMQSKGGHPQQNPVTSSSPKAGGGPLNSQQQVHMTSSRSLVAQQQHVNGDAKPNQIESQKSTKVDVSSTIGRPEVLPYKTNPASSSGMQASVPQRVAESTALPTISVADSTTAAVTSSQPISHDRRSGRGIENNQGEARTKVNKQLQDFSKNFVLENDPSRTETPEVNEESSTSSSIISSSSALPYTSSSPSAITESMSSSSEQSAATSSKASEKSEDSASSMVFKLNPLAKEFTPAVKASVAREAQSPSPQQRVSPQVVPHQMMYSPMSMYGYMQGIPPGMAPASVVSLPPQNKRGTVSVGRMNELAAHQAHHVTGQPLLATSPQMLYVQPNQSGGYQMFNPGSRMVTPNTFPMPQTGQGPIDPANPQSQPQPVFLTGQQQPMPAPIPAHLTQHPQPAHAQALSNPSANPTAQPTHVPNPSPSPVHHQSPQQTAQPYGGQPIPHHMAQGPPQSASSPYPPMNIHHGHPAMPRTSMAGQHGISQSGHPTVSLSYPMSTHSYHNAGQAQYSITQAAQPQTSQNSNPGNAGHQPHYVVMPHPPTHPPMQQQHHGQAYTTAGIQFQSGHNIVQGPSQIPPNHTHNPNQGGPHMIHPGMQAMQAGMQQVPGTPPMFVPVPSINQQYQHQQ